MVNLLHSLLFPHTVNRGVLNADPYVSEKVNVKFMSELKTHKYLAMTMHISVFVKCFIHYLIAFNNYLYTEFGTIRMKGKN